MAKKQKKVVKPVKVENKYAAAKEAAKKAVEAAKAAPAPAPEANVRTMAEEIINRYGLDSVVLAIKDSKGYTAAVLATSTESAITLKYMAEREVDRVIGLTFKK